MDRFLFDEAMSDVNIVNKVLKIILNDDTLNVTREVSSEREFRNSSEANKSIRLDIFTIDDKKKIYDIEAQKINTKNLPKRSRFYQSIIDRNHLKSGELDYNKLPDSYIIVISPFDLFGKNRYQYTFRARCDEDNSILLGDNAIRIFLNTRGMNDEETNPKLIALLKLFEKTNEINANSSNDKDIMDIYIKAENIKKDKEVGIKYMNAMEERYYDIQEATQQLVEKCNVLENYKKLLSDKNEALENNISVLSDKNEALENNISVLSDKNEALENNISVLSDKNEALENNISVLSDKNSALENDNNELQNELTNLNSKLMDKDLELAALKKRISELENK